MNSINWLRLFYEKMDDLTAALEDIDFDDPSFDAQYNDEIQISITRLRAMTNDLGFFIGGADVDLDDGSEIQSFDDDYI